MVHEPFSYLTGQGRPRIRQGNHRETLPRGPSRPASWLTSKGTPCSAATSVITCRSMKSFTHDG